ncbi:DUF6883 domain-containing protein [Spirosoma sp.]|uniref:DUF6883 domain-containing protein n=1 Tax=Spirosoma sp. TaxID=1899569 RepID=UPI003B3AD123
MKLEPPLQFAERKLTHYLLVFRDKDDKSNYLRLAGYTSENWRLLKQDLLTLAHLGEANPESEDAYGSSYSIVGELKGPNGRLLRVKTIWKRDIDEEITKFITLYPPKQ